MVPARPATLEQHAVDWSRFDSIVERFEGSWARGESPAIDDYLPSSDTGRLELLIELAHADLEHRWRAGVPARASSYLEQYPELAADANAARELFASEAKLRRHPQAAPDRSRESTAPSCGGARLGRFELGEEVGRGGFGVVYRAIDTELGRVVAAKVLRESAPPVAAEMTRLRREARHAARLKHPGIVTVHEVGQDGGQCYLISEFIEGTTLSQWAAGRAVTPRLAAGIALRVAEALEHAHSRGVMHRDVKPSNILIDGDGQPLLTDFGLARGLAGEATLTLDDQLMGTPAYMAPEQARGDGARWTLGATSTVLASSFTKC